MDGEFSVWIFFPDGSHVAELEWVDAETAVEKAKDVIFRPATRLGIIDRVIIVDGGDAIVFEFEAKKGITYPTKHE
jgi:hypothetical protein